MGSIPTHTTTPLPLIPIRWPQRPLIATTLLFSPLHLALASPGTPEEMPPIRPPRSVFHRSTFLSLLGQAGVHVTCMALAVRFSQGHSPEVGRCLCSSELSAMAEELSERFSSHTPDVTCTLVYCIFTGHVLCVCCCGSPVYHFLILLPTGVIQARLKRILDGSQAGHSNSMPIDVYFYFLSGVNGMPARSPKCLTCRPNRTPLITIRVQFPL